MNAIAVATTTKAPINQGPSFDSKELFLFPEFIARTSSSPANNRRTGIFLAERRDHQTVSTQTNSPLNNPINKLLGVINNSINGVEMAPTHHVRNPWTINHAYPIPSSTPEMAPPMQTSAISRSQTPETSFIGNPSACKTPISEARFCIVNRNNNVTKINADAITNMLSARNKPSNGVDPEEAFNPFLRMGINRIPTSAWSAANCSSNVWERLPASPVEAGIRNDVTLPKRLCHICFPLAGETNALGVVR